MPATWGYAKVGTQGATIGAWGYVTNLSAVAVVRPPLILSALIKDLITFVSRITDFLTIGAEMGAVHAIPGQWKRVEFDTKSGGILADSTISIVIRNPSRVTRVQYDASNLTKVSTGKYTYDFQVPDNVIVGDWYVAISATVGDKTTKRNIHFPVREV